MNLFAVLLPSVIVNQRSVRPTQRGFFCSDESIRYPYKERDTVSSGMVAAVCVLAALLLVRGMVLIFGLQLRDCG